VNLLESVAPFGFSGTLVKIDIPSPILALIKTGPQAFKKNIFLVS
jgi:hypothetical protein